ncbi:MAG: hypothetical protein IKU29_11860 [Parabacteroides sp.]|nr:hypothetical protein [Parabacteroides sp.]
MRDHPDIESIIKTGYPRYSQPAKYHCQECGKDITDEDMYEDAHHEYLCRDCLLLLHTKDWL